jgi:hypothetical protein
MTLQLRYGPVLVAELTDVIEHQGSWFARWRASPLETTDPTATRLRSFIAFCLDWNARCESGLEPEAAEFDAFRDVLNSRLWHTRDSAGGIVGIADAPYFSPDEISWRRT